MQYSITIPVTRAERSKLRAKIEWYERHARRFGNHAYEQAEILRETIRRGTISVPCKMPSAEFLARIGA